MVVWPERLLSAHIWVPGHAVTVHTTHIPPGSSNGWTKIEMVEAILAVACESSIEPRILCGDFNLPQAETPKGRIVTWGEQVTAGEEPRVRARRYGQDRHRWDRAERTLMEGGAPRVLIDAYRHLHGYGQEDFSWYLKRGAVRVGRRFHHIFCSRAVRIVTCEYRHDVREQGLSDHSALELDFEC
jgi:exonuclease III